LRFHGAWGSGRLVCMNLPADLNALSPEQLRTLAAQLIAKVQERDREIEEKTREVKENERELHYRQTRIEQLSHEISILKRQMLICTET
jgi:transposase